MGIDKNCAPNIMLNSHYTPQGTISIAGSFYDSGVI